jgi:hypothetical protein
VTADWNPVTVEKAIYDCAQRIANGVLKADRAYRLFQAAEHAHEIAFAKAYLANDGSPAHERKYRAQLETVDERKARDEADAAYKLMASNMKAVQSELDALRSLGVSIRQAYAVAGRGEGLEPYHGKAQGSQ